MGSRDIRNKNEKKPKKKDIKSPAVSGLVSTSMPAVELVKKKKHTKPEE